MNNISSDLSSTQEERNELRDSLRKTSELCTEMESKLSSCKREKEEMLRKYRGEMQNLEEMLNETHDASASVGLAITPEKDKHISDSSSQVSILTDVSTTNKSGDLTKNGSKDTTEKNTQLESSIMFLNAERDEANARAAELMSGFQQVLSSLSASVDEKNHGMARLESEKTDAIAKARALEETIREM